MKNKFTHERPEPSRARVGMFFLMILLLLSVCGSAKSQTYEEFIDLSFKYLNENNLPAAETVLKKAMRLQPDNPLNVLLLSNLGTIQFRQKKYDDALVSYTAALAQAPKNTALLTNRAELFTAMNQPENAITDYTAILLINDKDENALYRRGLLYLQVKNEGAAQTDLERIIELNPQTLEGRIGIASLCKMRKEFDEAEIIYFDLLDKYPDHSDLYAGRAELYILMNRPGKALSDINQAIRLQGENNPNPYFYIIRSKIKEMQYERKAAEEDKAKAEQLLRGEQPQEKEPSEQK